MYVIFFIVRLEITSKTKIYAFGPYPQYGWDFPEEIPEKFRKDPGNAQSVSWNFFSRVRLGSPKPVMEFPAVLRVF